VSSRCTHLEVNPSSHALDGRFPFLGVALNNRAAFVVIGGNTDLHHILLCADAELLINLVLDGKAMAAQSEA
jgi:hypothetical protein